MLRTLETSEGSTEGGARFVVPRDLEDTEPENRGFTFGRTGGGQMIRNARFLFSHTLGEVAIFRQKGNAVRLRRQVAKFS